MAALVGLYTNYAGVQLLFYPIEYQGTGWYRPPMSPLGFLGWQGVVPTKTEPMASRLVDIVTTRLLSLGEAFGRLDPVRTGTLLCPAVDDAVRDRCGPGWAAVLRPFLPYVLGRLVRALQGEVEDVLDLRSVVMSAFVTNKGVLVELFQRVGRVELNFLVESGLGFGAVLGLGQMALWARRPYPWTLPVAGAVVGYVTNWIAIRLLFEPADPIELGPLTLQGLFESRQVEVSEEFGLFLRERVLSSPRLLEALAEGGDGGELHSFLRRQLPWPIPGHVLSAAVDAIRAVAAHPELHPDLHGYMTEALDIEATLSHRLKLLTPTEFEDLLHPVFQEDEFTLIAVGGVLGAVAGGVQTRLGWGGPPALARMRAAATLVVAALSTVLFFVGREREILADEIEEDLEAVPAVVVPRLARRNTVVRVKE